MYTGKALFAQIMDFLPWKIFDRLVSRYDGDHRVHTLPCTEHFRVLVFCAIDLSVKSVRSLPDNHRLESPHFPFYPLQEKSGAF